MPKGKKKGKESRREREASSDEESLDNYSEHSAQSDVRSTHDDAEEEAEGGDAGQLESKVCECVEQLGAKAAATRAAAFTSLRTGLERKCHVLANSVARGKRLLQIEEMRYH